MARSPIVKALTYFPLYVLCFGLASALWRRPVVLAVCFLIMSGLMLLRWHRRSDLAYFFLSFVLGPAGEAVAIYNGGWTYAEAPFLIPLWLPFAWGISGLFLKKATEALVGQTL